MSKYSFSKRSLARLETVAPELRRVVELAMSMQVMDFSVICGVRTQDEQRALVAKGASRKLNSKHLPNKLGYSEAVDIAPYPLNWDDHEAFHRLAGVIQGAAALHNVALRWGGDWDGDNDTHDQSFIDLPHFEITER